MTSQGQTQQVPKEGPPDQPEHGLRVLVVDDDFMVARLHASVVTRTDGFELAGVADSGAAAVRAVQKERPDLVLMDVYLPDMTGLEAVRAMRAALPVGGPDVIVLSAARDVASLRAAQHAGVFQYLIKPFEVETLQGRLGEYAAFRSHLDGVGEAQQEDVDRMFRPSSARVSSAVPKGISAETTELVLGALRSSEQDLSAQECADVVGLSRSSARRYLEHLVDVGRAQVRHRYGTTGRPERRYRLT